MGRWLIDYSKVLGKPINQADIKGVGVAYSMREKEKLLVTHVAGERHRRNSDL